MWHTVGVDLIGPLPETSNGNKYIMTVCCLFQNSLKLLLFLIRVLLDLQNFCSSVLHDMDAARSKSVIREENLLTR